ncbi:FkbM family methyltransferase [Roseivivax sediminis]|uniref:Methyltransferase, FkbM family n=1 Tax=Roseivivax sediminis TaxID=936889 RepID=A0A1I2AYI6_9RHOB|nr:FkbM family methyltransferase [Roseivivax sediminis]SFE48886.1 methyltransferase, FkbM family [Roseivivax sediminis]
MTSRGARRRRTTRAQALGRSLDVYYRDMDRTARMDRLHARLVAPGALVFDIGAHVGDRTGSFLRRGARVVALEPQPSIFRALRLIHGRHARAVLLPQAAGAAAGEVELLVNSRNPTVSTAAPDFVTAAAGATGWEGQDWDGRVRVPVTTLDALIARHGEPDFVKIDVEGHEAAVLHGLSRPLPALSFEVTTIQRDVAHRCIDRLSALGRYEYNLSLGEAHELRPAWLDAEEMRAALDSLPNAANSGDVYARAL